ncbi:hypothetical protein TK90_2231 [Thioalkalivibrio sp. K90mix]|jgi:mRNA-degrading endonuclease RelE of RelBE toxin-antitoxin system|nr:hypothetical protein TK90_2231 [Thioalkalivibrio sp. K90mix]
MITVAETAPFRKKIIEVLKDDERADLIAYLAEHPSAGDLIQGTGGVRKLRWRALGRGKSGGIRVIYYFHNESMPLYLLAAKGNTDQCTRSRWYPRFSETRRVVQRVVVLPASGATQDRGTWGTNPKGSAAFARERRCGSLVQNDCTAVTAPCSHAKATRARACTLISVSLGQERESRPVRRGAPSNCPPSAGSGRLLEAA